MFSFVAHSWFIWGVMTPTRSPRVYYHRDMAPPVRFTVAKSLSELGLRKTLIAVKSSSGYAVSRIKKIDSGVELTSQGSFSSDKVSLIGRVGIPDPQLGVAWKNSMPFYGKWFDELGETDAGYHLRRNISSLSPESLLEQIERDDQYALVGSYYTVFQTIMKVKRRVPLVLIDDTYLSLISFPVVLAKIEDTAFEEKLMNVLSVMLKADAPVRRDTAVEPAACSGIEVDEISADDIGTYLKENED
jgi:hypothetical protein